MAKQTATALQSRYASLRIAGAEAGPAPDAFVMKDEALLKRSQASGADIVLVEVGGTVGDIESLPFLEAARQFELDAGEKNVLYIHLTLVPYIKVAD